MASTVSPPGRSLGLWAAMGLAVLFCPTAVLANGVLRDGYGTRSMALGGADVAMPVDVLSAIGGNPAGLGLLEGPAISLSATGIHGDATFENLANAHTDLRGDTGGFPDFAAALPLADGSFVAGFGLTVDSARVADWHYVDAPGGIDGMTSYGRQTHRAEFTALRATLGGSWKASERLLLGASVGLVYHRVRIDVPFIFQSEPTLRGWKTLLDLDTDGYGWDAGLGLIYRCHESFHVGLNYRLRSEVHSEGRARGNASAQLDSLGFQGVDPAFRYDARVETALPQRLSAGFSWQVHERVRLWGQIDWIDWDEAFDVLRIRLSDGSNDAVNGLTGGDRLRETVPVGWKDRLVYRAGMEADLTKNIAFQLGYVYGRSPVPTALGTPLNASIFEHTVTTGFSYRREAWRLDFAYQYYLPNAESVRESGYLSGEYDDSEVTLAAHVLAVGFGWSF